VLLIIAKYQEKNRYILNLGDNNGITPLHQAAYLGHTNCLTILVQSNCDLTPKDAQGRTPLHLASYNGHKDCTEILLEEIRAIDLPRPASQSVAAHKTLWRNHPNKVPLPPVVSEIVEKSINGGDEYGATALHLAAYNGQVECGRVLLEVIQNVNVSDIEGSSPLHKAAFGGHEEFLALFFSGKHKESCAVNAVDMFGDTPLHKAAYNGYDECAEILIQNGADRSLKDTAGYTALHNCAESKNLSCLDKIIDDKTINTTENNGFTALHLAVIESHLEVVQYLVSKLDIGVDINALDVSGRSPLYYAIEKANESITRELILEGADINVGHCTEIASSPISAINMDKLHQFVAEKERKEKMQKHMDPEMKAKISRIVALINAKPVKGLKMLIEEGIVETPTEIAEFLHQNEKLNKESIGELLGELDNKEIRKAFTEYLDFSNTSFEQALRHYLSTFKLPGEAQKIDRLMETFAHCFYEQTSDKSHFASPDAAFILAFSVIMLNTDAHNPAIKKQNRMTKQQFVNNNRGCNEGNDFDREFLEYIYDRIVEEEIKMPQAGGSIFNSAEKKGYLTKQGGRVKTWKKRWFVLASNNLYYFKVCFSQFKDEYEYEYTYYDNNDDDDDDDYIMAT
jgi:ankyrin repeat protein